MISIWRTTTVLAFVLLAAPGIPGVPAAPQGAQGLAMDLEVVGLRLLLGVTDKNPTPWDGSLRLSGGEVLRIILAGSRILAWYQTLGGA